MEARATKAIIFDCIGVLYTSNRSLFDGQVLNDELIEYIQGNLKPHYKIGLLSNIDRKWIDRFIVQHKLEGLFDAVVVSGDENIAKPNPIIYERMSEKLGVASENCLMIDDLEDNCIGAEKAGMSTIVFRSNNALFDDLKTS